MKSILHNALPFGNHQKEVTSIVDALTLRISMNSDFVVFSSASAQAFAVAQTAIDQGVAVRAVLRSGKSSALKGEYQIAYADLANTDSLVKAMAGARAAFFHVPIPTDLGQAELHLSNFLSAAKQTKLPLLIFSSSSFADESFSSTPLIDGNKYAVKQVLDCDIPAIVLKPGLYLENLHVPFFVPRLAQSILDYPPMKADQAISWISHWDQALIAVAALAKPQLAGSAYNIASREPVTPAQLAAMLGKNRGDVKMRFEAITNVEFAQRVSQALQNPKLNFLLSDLYRSINAQSAQELLVDTDQLERLFGVKLMSVSQRIASWPA
jgi:NAD(P)H dehydrogenase (quinone)